MSLSLSCALSGMGRAHYRHGKPRCRQEYDESGMNVIIYHDESHKESWQVLFMDLTLVALLINLSFFLYNCDNTAEAVFITGSHLSFSLSLILNSSSTDLTFPFISMSLCTGRLFFIFYNTRIYVEDFTSRFESTNYEAAIFNFGTLLGMFMMAAFSHTDSYESSNDEEGVAGGDDRTCDLPEKLYLGFTTGFCIARFSTLGMYLHTMWLDPKARTQFRYTVAMQATSLLIIFISFMVNIAHEVKFSESQTDSKPYDNVYYGTVIFEFLTSAFAPFLRKWFYSPGTLTTFYPLNVFQVQEQMGLFVLIVLGESFITLITVNPLEANEERVTSFLVYSFLILCGFAMTFFDTVQRHEDAHDKKAFGHAMQRSIVDGSLWRSFHGVVGFSLVLIGSALKSCYKHVVHDDAIEPADSHLLSCACGFYVLICTFLRSLHKGWWQGVWKKRRVATYTFYLSVAFGHFMVSFVPKSQMESDATKRSDTVLILHLVLSLSLNIGDIIGGKTSFFDHAHEDEIKEEAVGRRYLVVPIGILVGSEDTNKFVEETEASKSTLETMKFVDFFLAKEDWLMEGETMGDRIKRTSIDYSPGGKSPLHHT